ncbi:MAG: cytochrome c-type biogenesis protein CcmH [Acidobacteria bacterium]|nr:cytochrome c-type biogenesis protein CcmH [Acidobacteriota bacterium]
MRRSALLLSLLAALLVPVEAATSTQEALDLVTAKLICNCGCNNLTIKDCTCGKADRVRAEVKARLDSGQTPAQIVSAYVDEYGEQILAAPTAQGFNLVGWIAPFAALLLAAAFLVLALRRWARVPWHEPPLVPAGPGSPRAPDPSFLKRVEDEIEDVER